MSLPLEVMICNSPSLSIARFSALAIYWTLERTTFSWGFMNLTSKQ